VIELIMFFALGFLSASLVALVLLSAVWHRAVRLTTKRIEGAIPVSMAEIQADKDQLRAEFAMSTRRLETSVEHLKLKTTEQFAELGRKNDTIRKLKQETEEKSAKVGALEAQERVLRQKLVNTEEELSLKSKELHLAESELARKAGAVWMERIARTYPACVWLNPVPESQWQHTHSIRMMKQLMGGRMYPLTLDGLDRAMRELVR